MAAGKMTIKCDDFEQFMSTVYSLVTKGLTFEADASKLIITLTGGY